jgi:hypothetical protein
MQILSDGTKDSVKLAWLSFVEALYTFPPVQRAILIFGVIMIVPAYWLFRVGAHTWYNYQYKGYQVQAQPSFTNPQALVVSPVTVLPAAGGFMGYAKIQNPNLDISATTAQYHVRFYNSAGQQAYETTGQFYAPAGKDAFVVIPRFIHKEAIAKAQLEVTAVRWQKKISMLKVDLNAPAPTVFEDASGVRLEGVVTNASPYKINSVRIVMFLYDANNRIVGVGERVESTVMPNQRRAYVMNFPGITKSQFVRTLPVVDTNIADSRNINANDLKGSDQNPGGILTR